MVPFKYSSRKCRLIYSDRKQIGGCFGRRHNTETVGNLGGFAYYLDCGVAAAAKSLQSCLTLCDPRDGSPPGSPVPGILQARTLEWVAMSFSNAWKWKVKEKSLSRVRLLVTPWTAAYQAPPSMRFSGQQYWSGVPLPSPDCGVNLMKLSTLEIFCVFPVNYM